MRIMLVNHFPLDGSGSGTYTKNIAVHLAMRGHQVCVVFPENEAPQEIPGVSMRYVRFSRYVPRKDALPFNFPCFTTHPRSVTTFGDLDGGELAQYLTAFDTAIMQAIDEFKPELIHAQHVWCLAWLSAQHGIPTVITTHGTDLMGCEKWPEFQGFAELAAKRCEKIIAVSGDNMRALHCRFPETVERTVLLHNGYNEDVFFPVDANREELMSSLGINYNGEQIVLFVGKLTAFKGADTLLRAAKQYERLEKGKIITLIVGSGDERKKLEALKDSLGLKGVFFLGHREQEELRRLYSTADVLAVPSRKEPFGLVALEAMACGLPVVASNEGGLPEFINSEVGALVPVDNEDMLCGAILEELLRSHEDPRRRAEISRYVKECFTQRLFVIKLEQLYVSTLSIPRRLRNR